MRHGSADRTLLLPFERLERKGARGLRSTAFEEQHAAGDLRGQAMLGKEMLSGRNLISRRVRYSSCFFQKPKVFIPGHVGCF